MPVYEFQCKKCGILGEAYSRIEDKPDSIPCDVCGGQAVSMPSKVAIIGATDWSLKQEINADEETVLSIRKKEFKVLDEGGYFHDPKTKATAARFGMTSSQWRANTYKDMTDGVDPRQKMTAQDFGVDDG